MHTALSDQVRKSRARYTGREETKEGEGERGRERAREGERGREGEIEREGGGAPSCPTTIGKKNAYYKTNYFIEFPRDLSLQGVWSWSHSIERLR